MSELNGDKARLQRLRKAKLRRRQRTREVWAAIRGGATRIHSDRTVSSPAELEDESGRFTW